MRLLHPSNGAVVNVGPRVVVDVQLSLPLPYDGDLHPDFAVCVRVGPASLLPVSAWSCFNQFSTLSLRATTPGPHRMDVALVGRPPAAAEAALNAEMRGMASLDTLQLEAVVDVAGGAEQLSAQASALAPTLRERLRLVSWDSSSFTAEDRMTCAGRLGEGGCGRPIQKHCTSPNSFRFFLYHATFMPTTAAAEVYYALRDSPLRTLDADPAVGEACVFIAVGDVHVADGGQAGSSFVSSSKRLTRLPFWNGTGANHLIISYADYGALRQLEGGGGWRFAWMRCSSALSAC